MICHVPEVVLLQSIVKLTIQDKRDGKHREQAHHPHKVNNVLQVRMDTKAQLAKRIIKIALIVFRDLYL